MWVANTSIPFTTQTLTKAEAYHNLAWEMRYNRDVPIGAIGVRACFDGEVRLCIHPTLLTPLGTTTLPHLT